MGNSIYIGNLCVQTKSNDQNKTTLTPPSSTPVTVFLIDEKPLNWWPWLFEVDYFALYLFYFVLINSLEVDRIFFFNFMDFNPLQTKMN